MRRPNILPYVFLSPTVLVLLLLSYLPMPYALYLSLTKSELGTGTRSFIGFDNFKTIYQDSYFWESFSVTMYYTFFATLSMIVLGLVLAMTFNRKIRFRSFYMTVLFIPWVISEVVTGQTWKWLLNPNYGLLNYLFEPFGLKPSIVLTSTAFGLIGLIIVTIWKNIAYSTLLLLAGLQGISKDLTEAAKIDGCSSWKVLRYITLPLLRPTIMVVSLLLIINCMNQTGIILVFTNGGPIRSTETLGVYMYKEAFMNYHLSNAASIAVVLAFINLFIVAAYFKFAKPNT